MTGEPCRYDLEAPDPRLRASVIIPARNEADELPATLAALANQLDAQAKPLDPPTYEVIVLANNCSDETATVARRFAGDAASGLVLHVVERNFPAAAAHIGTARQWLMDLACNRLEAVGRDRGLIASTDADTRVNSRWLAASLAEIEAGADAVTGMIQVAPADLKRLGPRVRRAYWEDCVYRRLVLELEALLDPNPLDPFPRHDCHGGASFAITPATYRRVGGLPPLPCLEDVALAESLWRVDARFVHSTRVRVETSARLIGRATGGQSLTIARWADGPTGRVIEPTQVEAEFRSRRRLRRLFHARFASGTARWQPDPTELVELAQAYRVDPVALRGVLVGREAPFGEWLATLGRLRRTQAAMPEPVLIPAAAAIQVLRERVRALNRARRA